MLTVMGKRGLREIIGEDLVETSGPMFHIVVCYVVPQ